MYLTMDLGTGGCELRILSGFGMHLGGAELCKTNVSQTELCKTEGCKIELRNTKFCRTELCKTKL